MVHSRLASVQAGRAVRLSEPFPYSTKSIRPCKSVCALCIEKKKKAPSGRGKQTTYKCKQCVLTLCREGFFGIPRAAKCGGAKLGE